MSELTCPEVEAQIELYAAGEGPPNEAAIEAHLAHCPACTRAYEEAQHVLGLLDLRWQEPRLRVALRRRIEAEARRRGPSRIPSFVQRVRSLAALLLVTFGLAWLGSGLREADLQRRMNLPMAVVIDPAPAAEGVGARMNAKAVAAHPPKVVYPLDPDGRTLAALRQVQAGGRPRHLPPPPRVHLSLQLRNDSGRTLVLWLGGSLTRLRLDLRGPDVVAIPAEEPAFKPFAAPQKRTIAPGELFLIPVQRLVDGSNQSVRYLYWTKPGEYTLTAHLQVLATFLDSGRSERPLVTFTSQPLTLEVEGQRP